LADNDEAQSGTSSRRPKPLIGIVGAGTMGAGIGQVALEHGHEVVLYDIDEAAVERGRARIRDGLRRRARKRELAQRFAQLWVQERMAGLREVTSLEDLAAQCDWVIEAALEDLALKQTIFRTLDAAADARVGLATNTSALSVEAIAAVTDRPDRVLGLHFFNPAPLMRLVEVVATPETSAAIAAAAATLVESWGKAAVRAADRPGFIVNRVNRPFTLEPLRILEAGRGTIEGIDRAVQAAGYPLGPFAYMDLVGLDVNLAAARGIFEALGDERFRPSALQENLVDGGRLGRKAGRGFYRYEASGDPVPEAVGPGSTAAPLTDDEILERIELAITNEAFHAIAEGVASEVDVDRAMELGANHPMGPIARARALGLVETRRRLEALAALEGDRFAPAPGLADAR
jgi:3-hydroxybutyryl-CoA dehydrogenase